MNILGISAFYHDSAAAIIKDNEIIAAAQEERFTRKKHDSLFPSKAVKFCLEYAGISIDKLDAVAFYEKPFLRFERLLETYYSFAPRGLVSFITMMPVWLKEKIFLKSLILKELQKVGYYNAKKIILLFPEHHLSHAASAFYTSPFSESAIMTIDGVGEWTTTSLWHGEGNKIKILKELKFPHSLGLLYSAFTYYIGFKVNSGEYKLMGLAPYGNPSSQRVKHFIDIIKKYLVDIRSDGSFCLNQKYFNYATGLTMVNDKQWEKLFGFPRRAPDAVLGQNHCDLALAIQKVTEEIILLIARELKHLIGSSNLCLAGGVALNCVANGALQRENIFKNIFIQPAAGDAGGAIGAALAASYIYYNQTRKSKCGDEIMKGAFLGMEYGDKEIKQCLTKNNAVYHCYENFNMLANMTASLLSKGHVVGWFQGRMEFGPRALGNRSILGDARDPSMQKRLNIKIKFREGFRPFAPSVLAEDARDYFELEDISPYMLLVHGVRSEKRKLIPEGYHDLEMANKLYHIRSDIPAVTHVDFSARIQTVHRETNKRFWQLLNAFKELTGCPVLINTSFNVRGEPMVCTPHDAYQCFIRTEMDYLVIGNFLLDKKEQHSRKEDDSWVKTFQLD